MTALDANLELDVDTTGDQLDLGEIQFRFRSGFSGPHLAFVSVKSDRDPNRLEILELRFTISRVVVNLPTASLWIARLFGECTDKL